MFEMIETWMCGGASFNTFFELLQAIESRQQFLTAYCELHRLWRFKIMNQEVRGHHFDEKRYELFGPGGPTFGDLVVPSQFPSCKVRCFTKGQGTS